MQVLGQGPSVPGEVIGKADLLKRQPEKWDGHAAERIVEVLARVVA